MRSRSTLLVISLVILAAVVRIIGTQLNLFPANFSTIGAMALFAGAAIRPRLLGVLVPLVALAASDLILGHGLSRWLLLYVYLPFAVVALGAGFLQPQKSLARFAGTTFSGAVVFFLVSNFGVWVTAPEMYARSVNGLLTCFAAGLPFFKNSLAGDCFFASVLFGCWYFAEAKSSVANEVA